MLQCCHFQFAALRTRACFCTRSDAAVLSLYYPIFASCGSDASSAVCAANCTNHGRYCAPDPDGDIKKGASGKDVIIHSLRSLCVFNQSAQLWWDYFPEAADRCRHAASLSSAQP